MQMYCFFTYIFVSKHYKYTSAVYDINFNKERFRIERSINKYIVASMVCTAKALR